MTHPFSLDIAIIGYSCRFPGADNVQAFWDNLINNRESIQHFTTEELRTAGISSNLLEDPNYIKAKGVLNNLEWFDANFFDFNAYDAKMTDPSQRLFLECAWEALEMAGYPTEEYGGSIGVYASMADSSYLYSNLLKNMEFLQSFDWLQARIFTSMGGFSTQVSYKFNLTGPSINLSTACSSALTSIVMACKALIEHDCEISIAGAASISIPEKQGYFFQEGGIYSPDGHCKPFDNDAKGTVFSNGLGAIVLKRLEDAVKDGDTVHAVIKGWNINNDGADKIGYTAPSVNGQAKCMAAALNLADIGTNSISYLEAHGTATQLGDAIEFKAFEKVFGTNEQQMREASRGSLEQKPFKYCAIGSVKSNIGHIDIAAGMASIFKTTLALKNKVIPGTLHFTKSNENINIDKTPFYINSTLKPWNVENFPRRAGINSSGIGGTNAFLVLEEYIPNDFININRTHQLLLISAKTEMALNKSIENLQNVFNSDLSQSELANIAFTLQVGRKEFEYRSAVVCESSKEAHIKLQNKLNETNVKRKTFLKKSKIAFMFTGQGAQYVGMANALYYSEPTFAYWVDLCCEKHFAVKEVINAVVLKKDVSTDINNTIVTQLALFTIEYALAKFLIELGIEAEAYIGHSIGEYVAACLADVFSLEDALNLIYHRAQKMSKTKPGSMLLVEADPNTIYSFLEDKILSVAVINSPHNFVISGEISQIDKLEQELNKKSIFNKKLRTSHAFHSELMEPILDSFLEVLKSISFNSPKIPIISNVTGDWINDQIANPEYWTKHLRQTVLFSDGVQTLYDSGFNTFIEVGPGQGLMNFTKQILKGNADVVIEHILPGKSDNIEDQESFLTLLGNLWQCGIKINWVNFGKNEKRQRVPIPTYPFERKKYWAEPNISLDSSINLPFMEIKKPYENWFYEPSWERASIDRNSQVEGLVSKQFCWIFFLVDDFPLDPIFGILSRYNQLVIKIHNGENFKRNTANDYTINFSKKTDYQKLIQEIISINVISNFKIINCQSLTKEHNIFEHEFFEIDKIVYSAFYSNLFIVQTFLEEKYNENIDLLMISNEVFSVNGTENICPAKATSIGPCRVIPLEHPNFNIKILDFQGSDLQNEKLKILYSEQIIYQATTKVTSQKDMLIAYRGLFVWKQVFCPLTLTKENPTDVILKEGGCYLFTGGLGGISLTIAEYLTKNIKNVHLILMSHTSFPDETLWDKYLAENNDHSISEKIRIINNLKKMGANISIFIGSVEKMDELTEIIKKSISKYKINGIFHAAGNAGGGLAQLKTYEMTQKVLEPKVRGTYALLKAIEDISLDFIILFSSISSMIGKYGQVDYCAANACLDAFGNSKYSEKNNIMIINWNTWREVGMGVDNINPNSLLSVDKNNNISPEEGIKIFSDMINNSFKQMIVSTIDIQYLIKMSFKPYTFDEKISRKLISSSKNKNMDSNLNQTESELLNLFEELLEVKGIHILDDFKELGIHSLMMLRLLTIIEKKFNIKISLQVMQESKNIKTLSDKISNMVPGKNQKTPAIVILRSEGKKNPLFCFHPVGGTIFCYSGLAKILKYHSPIYGLKDPSIEEKRFLFNSIEEMASIYILNIRKIQKKGPYLLAGLSFGGMLAVEVGKQLNQMGEKVMPLILFDAWAKFSDIQYDENLFKETMANQKNSLMSDKLFIDLSWKRMELLLNYKIPKINNKIILFKAQTLLPEYFDIDHHYNHWDKYTAKEVKTVVVPGDHETILTEPNVNALCENLDLILNSDIYNELYEKVE